MPLTTCRLKNARAHAHSHKYRLDKAHQVPPSTSKLITSVGHTPVVMSQSQCQPSMSAQSPTAFTGGGSLTRSQHHGSRAPVVTGAHRQRQSNTGTLAQSLMVSHQTATMSRLQKERQMRDEHLVRNLETNLGKTVIPVSCVGCVHNDFLFKLSSCPI